MGPFKIFPNIGTLCPNGPTWVLTRTSLLLQMGYSKNFSTSYNMGSLGSGLNATLLSTCSPWGCIDIHYICMSCMWPDIIMRMMIHNSQVHCYLAVAP